MRYYYKDEQRPLIQNEFLYKAIVRTTNAYFQDIMEKCDGLDWLEEEKLLNKIGHKELEFYLACEKMVKELQYLESTDRVKVKMELAKIYRWFEERSEELSRLNQNFFDPDLRRKPK